MSTPHFPYAARREKRKPVDHGPDNKVFTRYFWIGVRDAVVFGFVLAIGFVFAALSIWFESKEDLERF
jgi:hypothetical protein